VNPGASSSSAASSPATPVGLSVLPQLQAGFGASTRNFKKAVDRNRIKRLSREAYRLQKQTLYDHLVEKNRCLAVFFIYTGKELPDYGTVTEKIGVALQKLIKETGQ
jgi:ribonuclease P protein component